MVESTEHTCTCTYLLDVAVWADVGPVGAGLRHGHDVVAGSLALGDAQPGLHRCDALDELEVLLPVVLTVRLVAAVDDLVHERVLQRDLARVRQRFDLKEQQQQQHINVGGACFDPQMRQVHVGTCMHMQAL